MKKKLIQYTRTALYNIKKSKGYAAFCIFGTALTFIFIIFLVQMAYSLLSDSQPGVNASRTFMVENGFRETNSRRRHSLSPQEIQLLLDNMNMGATATFLYQTNSNIVLGGTYQFFLVGFVDAAFWEVYRFKFVAGRPFTQEEFDMKKRCAVITKKLSKTYFHTVNSVGKKMELRGGVELEVIGVVDNFPMLASPTGNCDVWIPHTFNPYMDLNSCRILFPPRTDMAAAREAFSRAVVQTFSEKNIPMEAKAVKVRTEKEIKKKAMDGAVLGMGAALILLLLLIPAINILTLNIAHSNNRAEEVAVRRTFGASRRSAFFQLMFEDLLLVATGTLIGVVTVSPLTEYLIRTFLDNPMLGTVKLIAGVDLVVVAGVVLPLMVLFLFMFGAIPAYLVAKRNITGVLKGGA